MHIVLLLLWHSVCCLRWQRFKLDLSVVRSGGSVGDMWHSKVTNTNEDEVWSDSFADWPAHRGSDYWGSLSGRPPPWSIIQCSAMQLSNQALLCEPSCILPLPPCVLYSVNLIMCFFGKKCCKWRPAPLKKSEAQQIDEKKLPVFIKNPRNVSTPPRHQK